MPRVSKEQIAEAREVDLVRYLETSGYSLEKHGNGTFHLADHDSVVVYTDTNSWYSFREDIGGNPLDFATKYEHQTLPRAVESLLGRHGLSNSARPAYVPADRPPPEMAGRTLKLPARNPDMKRTFAYLCNTRGIDSDVVSQFVHERTLYESAVTHNAVFVGKDEQGAIQYAHAKGTNSYTPFRQDLSGSDKSCGFSHAGTSDRLHVFEAPVDLLSYVSLHPENWQQDSYLSLGGVSDKALNRYLDAHPNIGTVSLCLDNDEAGRAATGKLRDYLHNKGYITDVQMPDTGKDWSDALLAKRSQNQATTQSRPAKATTFLKR